MHIGGNGPAFDATERDKLREVFEPALRSAEEHGLQAHCDRCLETRRWDGNVVLMVVDAGFTSVGLDYFNAVVPSVVEFESAFVETREIETLEDLSGVSLEQVSDVWASKRSWNVARGVAAELDARATAEEISETEALRGWARDVELDNWEADAIGAVDGVGINTVQYLRMMGGVDTAMPDGIVRRVTDRLLKDAGVSAPTAEDLALVRTIDALADVLDRQSIEVCWMTWLVESEGRAIAEDRHPAALDRI